MRIGLLTREYPPEIYGGAGVHVEFLARELRRLIDVDVRCFGGPRDEAGVRSYGVPPALTSANAALQTLGCDVEIAADLDGLDVLHSHTWYANLAGVLGSMLHGAPHVLTAHSLEPRRPWKAEQLGGGYRISSWAEQQAYASADAVVAVSAGMAADVLDAYPFVSPDRVHVIHNGIDTALYRPLDQAQAHEEARRQGLDPERPIAVFVGRITRQKGVDHLLAAAGGFDPGIQLAFCAGAPDTPQIAEETAQAVADLQQRRDGVVWVRENIPRERLVALLSAASVFVCPSIYEPLGIVNLEAMACRTPVVASDVGGIPEVVQDGVTGVLVHYDARHPEAFRAGLAAGVNEVVADPARAAAMGEAGRERAVREFGWDSIAAKTVELYRSLL